MPMLSLSIKKLHLTSNLNLNVPAISSKEIGVIVVSDRRGV